LFIIEIIEIIEKELQLGRTVHTFNLEITCKSYLIFEKLIEYLGCFSLTTKHLNGEKCQMPLFSHRLSRLCSLF